MKTWKATVEDPIKRKIDQIEVYAPTQQEALGKARKKGRVLSIKRKWGFEEMIKPKLKIDERQMFLQRLGTMQECKMGASEALRLIERTFTGSIQQVAHKMLKYVEQGDDIPSAMENIGEPDFPRNMVALVKAGSKSGSTGTAIKHAAEFELEIEAVKKNNVWALYFSIMGFIFAAITIFGTKYYFAPAILGSEMVKMAGDAVDTTWAINLMNFSAMAMAVMALMFFTLMGLGTLGRIVAPSKADQVVVRIPFYKDLVLARNNYVTLYALATLVGNGVPMEQSLGLAAESTPKGIMRDDLELAVQAVKRGKDWAEAMRYLHPTDRAALSSVQDREQAARALRSLSDQYRQLYGQRVKATTPIFMLISASFLVMAGIVLFGLGVEPILQIAAKGAV
jgi:general secretion pathway protein F